MVLAGNSELIRRAAAFIEENGHFRFRVRRVKRHKEFEFKVVLQFEERETAEAFARYLGKKVYGFGDVWSVYLTGQRLMLFLALGRDHFCPAHRRLADLMVQVKVLNEVRRRLGRKSFSRVVDEVRAGYRRKSGKVAEQRDELVEEMVRVYGEMPERCPQWRLLGGPFQRRLRAWWAENRPVENAVYWERKRARL